MRRLVSKVFLAMGYRIQRATITPNHVLKCDPAYGEIIERVTPFTSTTYERIAALADATRYIVRAGIPGAIVECGVWRGGSIMVAALTLLQEGELRDLYLFDTFAGMTAPTDCDVDFLGASAKELYAEYELAGGWSSVSLEDVRRNVLSTGYPEERIHFIRGDVLQTIPHASLNDIAILRLDTDFYESTLHELKQLYPLLQPGGILIIDDFGYWQGCRKAVDEYFGSSGPFLSIIDHGGRLLVKPGGR
jgi:SAM-dependent methyltransferase